jgi:hypothetical protein
MGQDYGIAASHPRHTNRAHEKPARYLVVIDSGGASLARLFLDTREQVAEFDGGSEEVSMMSAGLQAAQDAAGPEWDHALAGHSAAERKAADVYTLDV